MTNDSQAIIPAERIETGIFLIRGQKVMLDSDLASLNGVSTKRLNEQVKRNRHRFPPDFMFQLSANETKNLRSQFATSSGGPGGRRHRPYVFSEHGAVMLASVLNSKIAVEASVQVVRAFVRLRQVLATHKQLAAKLAELEARIEGHDASITALFQAIRQLMEPPEKARKRIGFAVETTAL
jgi:predicted acylesterase/phospholipase RssA